MIQLPVLCYTMNDSASDWIELSSQALSTAQAVRFVTHPAAGGIDVFLGTTRHETSPQGHTLLALDYESYPEMAIQQMQSLAQKARQRWPILKLVLLHRTGRVQVGEASVVIAVAAPHRAEAFDACRWLIDSLKSEVAIWKKEVWGDGSTSWVEGLAAK